MDSAGLLPEEEIITFLQEIYPVSRETIGCLGQMVHRLKIWQSKTNLVAPNTLDEIWTRHVADSLQCLEYFPNAKSWTDIGSGGGFPGLVLSIVLGNEPVLSNKNPQIYLIESIAKKCAFLRQTNRECGGVAKVVCGRIENEITKIEVPEVVTARALAELPLLLELSAPALLSGATGLFHKGRDYMREVENCRGLWEFDLIEHRSRIETDSVLLEVRNLRTK